MSEPHVLSLRQRELIAISASVAGNCLPCLRYHFAEAVKTGCTLGEITEAIGLSRMVKERPIKDIYDLADELLQGESEPKTSTQNKGNDNADV